MRFAEFLRESKKFTDFEEWQKAVKQARAADVEQSNREYIAQRQQREKNYQAAYAEMVRDDDEDDLTDAELEKKLKAVAQKYKLRPEQVKKLRAACDGPMGCPTGPVKEATELHLMQTGSLMKKFDGRKVDFIAAVEATHGRIKPQKGKDGKRYYVKGGKVVAKYDDLDDKGYVYK